MLVPEVQQSGSAMYISPPSLCVCVFVFGSYILNLAPQRFGVNEMTEKSSNAVRFALGPLLVEVSAAAVSSRCSLYFVQDVLS